MVEMLTEIKLLLFYITWLAVIKD